MKPSAIIGFGLVACVLAYGGVYYGMTRPARELQNEEAPELAWLKREFGLSDIEFQRISKLHEEYLPRCMEMCEKIQETNDRLRGQLEKSTNVTAEVSATLNEAARLRAQCQAQMLDHFFQVSRTMPEAQGKRYLEWVRVKTLQSSGGMSHGTSADEHEGHH